MTTLTIEEIKTYCRIDENADAELQELQQAAEVYINNAVDAKDKLNYDNKVYRLLVLMLVNHWYNNRDHYSGFAYGLPLFDAAVTK